jgi:pimeloyl-ACP methyl ester carboxylesterase
MLLDYEFVHDRTKVQDFRGGVFDEEPPQLDATCENTTTVMLLHGEFANKSSCRGMARGLLRRYRKGPHYNKDKPIVCLLVDLRGHGASDAHDYSEPHDVPAATDDVMDLIAGILPDDKVCNSTSC